jgi:transposase
MKKHQQSSTLNESISCRTQIESDFSSRDLYVGIDIHKKQWQIAVYYEGLILGNVSIGGCAERLIEYLRKRYGDAHFHCVFESCEMR